ncbi:YusU family protein [Metabacillus herbersteinensis]|uniref:YusU family protein n=1 Tax=Metabacillus herbersteinensis TaxID=283816 RepID=A0ABV6GBC8_9BACI
MNHKLEEQFEGLLEKYTELLLGEATPELKDKVKMWALYTHIAKSMPPLAKHWNESYPDAKENMKSLISEIKTINETYRAEKAQSNLGEEN